MALLVDDRAGSNELIKPLIAAGLPVESARLDSADIVFLGRGEGGKGTFIGIEHKKVPDLIASLNSGRLAGLQLLRMLDTYDRNWLVVEGDWTHDSDGRTSMWAGKGSRRPVKGAPQAMELEKRLLTLEIRGGFKVRHCPTRRDTIRFITALYRYWTDQDLDEHKSHLALHAPDQDAALKIPLSDFRKAVQMLLPGVGYAASRNLEDYFNGSFRRLMLCPESEWAEMKLVDGKGNEKRLGAARAKKIVEALK